MAVEPLPPILTLGPWSWTVSKPVGTGARHSATRWCGLAYKWQRSCVQQKERYAMHVTCIYCAVFRITAYAWTVNACVFFKASWYAAEWLQVAAAPTTSSGCMEDGGPLWWNQKILRCSTRKNTILLQSASTLIASLVYKTGRIVLQSFLVAASLSRTFQTRRYLNLPSIPPNLPICLEPSTSSNRPKTFGTVQYLQNTPETSLCGTAACPSPTVETQYGHRPLH